MNPREWRNVILFALAIMALTTIPYLAGAVMSSGTTDSGLHFGGFMFGVEDGNSYLAKMRQGANGAWAYTLAYTTEPHEGAFIFVPYLILGKIAALLTPPQSAAFTGTMLLVFHVARLVFGFGLILVTYRFIAIFVRRGPLRWLALVLICLGGGLGWLLVLTGNGALFGTAPVDMILPEGYTFYLLYGLPHLSLARIGLLGGLLAIFRALQRESPHQWVRWSLLASALWLLMALCVPFYVAVLYAILGAWGVAALISYRRFPAGLFWRCAVGTLIPAPMLAYNLYIFNTNPVLRAFQAQNLLPSPHPLHYVFGYGVYVVLALPAFGWAWRRAGEIKFLLPLAWLIIAPILAYFPVEVQRRFLEGVFVPLCIMAVMGLRLWWIVFLRGKRAWRIATVTLLLLTLPTSILVMVSGALAVIGADREYFHEAGEITVLDWLAQNAPKGAIVLVNPATGNYLPAYTDLRPYVGHGVETVDYKTKAALVGLFFQRGGMTPTDMGLFLQSTRVDYVIFMGEWLPDDALADALKLRLVYSWRTYRVYEVQWA